MQISTRAEGLNHRSRGQRPRWWPFGECAL